MRISEVLRRKGHEVVTIGSDATIAELVELLGKHGIGAVVVTDRAAPVGIVSERDVVRHLRGASGDYLSAPVQVIMTADVHTCGPDDDTEAIARDLTEHRIRHVPVVADGKLVGIVSIGDLVKQRIDELQAERDHLTHYLQS